MFIPYDAQTKQAIAPALAGAAMTLAPMALGAMGGGAKKPKAPNPMTGKVGLAAMQTAGGSPNSATHPQNSGSTQPKSPDLTHTPGAEGAFASASAGYTQPEVPQMPKVQQPKKAIVHMDTAINAASAFTPILYDANQNRKAKKQDEQAEIKHLENQVAQSKTRTAGLNPVPMVSNYVEGMGHAGLDALTEEQRVRNSDKHLPLTGAKRPQV